jgi:N-acetylglucosamine-6-sulfatase
MLHSRFHFRLRLAGVLGLLGLIAGTVSAAAPAAPRNIVLILTDDHRFDAAGFMGHPFLETPHLDRLAREGVHCANAFVTTALCSPSRASILTGRYMHGHGVVDNATMVRPDLVLFPQLLQRAGYRTGFFGKWHMGTSAEPQRGFDRWVSFRGQGEYLAINPAAKTGPNRLNVDGQWVPRRGYVTDELTDYAVEWLRTMPREQPFFLYLSHKAAHGICVPAERHKGRYEDKPLPAPASRHTHEHAPMWVRNQRNSWHGIDFPYHNADPRAWESEYRRYTECLLAVDDSVGRVMAELQARGQLDDTVIVYAGDNGFGFGDHGLIDKRVAYDWSMRIPLIVHCPRAFAGGRKLSALVANIDLAPTLLDAAGVPTPAGLDGGSFWPLLRGETVPWRRELLYEYYWERGFPQTPTLHALRGERYKYIRSQGIWDIDELYDLESDPGETRNLIFSPEHAQVLADLDQRLIRLLESSGGLNLPLQRTPRGRPQNLRHESGAPPATFPPALIRPEQPRPQP